MRILLSAIFCIFSLFAFSQANVKIQPSQYYDLDRHANDEMGTGFHPINWFTGFASHNPKGNGMSSTDTAGWYTPVRPFRPSHYPKDTSDLNGMSYYRGDRGWRLIYDWVPDKDPYKLAKYHITDIYGLQMGGDFLDTLYFYNVDTIFTFPAHQRGWFLARADSLLQPFAKLVQGHTTVWRPEWDAVTGLNQNMRYMMVVMKKRDRGSFDTYPNFSELVFYGNKAYLEDTIQYKTAYTGPRPKRKPVGKFVGVNNVGVLLSQLGYDAVSREYIAMGNFDDDVDPYPSNTYNANPFSFATSYWNANFGQAATEGRIWFETIRAGSKYLEVTGHGNVAKSLPVTVGNMEPEAWESYRRMGNAAFHYASLYGHNTAHTDAEFRFINKSQLPGYGWGFRSYFEPGNEDETRGSTILAQVMMHMVTYDGMEGEFNDGGIKKGDSTMKFVMPATVYIDTNMYKTMIWLSKILRNDKKVIYDVFNGHHYSRKYPNPTVVEHDPTFEEQVGTSGATPEWDRMYYRIREAEDVIWRETNGDTSKRFALTEWGYDNWSTPSSSVADLTFGPPYFTIWTISNTPKVAGRDSLQGKGMLMVRGESIFASTSMAWYNEYMITNNFFDPDNAFPGLFARSGRGAAAIPPATGSNIDIPTKFANYWARASFYSGMKNYYVDSLISLDSLGVCLIKWRHQSLPDSVCYEAWRGTWNGSQTVGYTINVGSITGNANRYTLSYTQATGATQLQAVSGGILGITVTEEPKFYFVQETGGPPPPPTTTDYFLKKHRKVIFSH